MMITQSTRDALVTDCCQEEEQEDREPRLPLYFTMILYAMPHLRAVSLKILLRLSLIYTSIKFISTEAFQYHKWTEKSN